MYEKACKDVVLLNKPYYFFTFFLRSPSLLLKLPIVCLADVTKESVFESENCERNFGSFKSSKLSYFYATDLLYQKVYQVKTTMLFLFDLLI